MSAEPQKKCVFNNIYNYHIPDEETVLKECKSIDIRDTKNPVYSKPKTHLEKAVFYLRICDNLIRNKQQEPCILEEIVGNINYFLRQLLEVASEYSVMISPLIELTSRYSSSISPNIGGALLQILKQKYPTLDTSRDPPGGSLATWCHHHMTQIHDAKNYIRDSFISKGNAVYSMSKFSFVSVNLFHQDFVWEKYPDIIFNQPYNLVVFWATVLRKYEMVISNAEVEYSLYIYTSLMKDEVKGMVTFLLSDPKNNIKMKTLIKTVDFLYWKLQRMTPASTCTSLPQEIISLIQKLRWNYII